MTKKKRILCLFDYGENCFTGFATVSRNIVAELKKNFKDNLQLDICAINYYGEPYYEPNGTYVFSAKLNDVQNDDFGRFLFLKVLQESNWYDGIFIIQDIAIVSPIVPHLKMLLEEKKANNRKSFKTIVYFPVDCPLFPSIIEPLSFFDTIVTYTEYARTEVLRHCPNLKTKIKVIPHGNNSKDFYPLESKEISAFRSDYFGVNANKFIISNISRNQPRKDLPSTIFSFIELKKEWASLKLNKEPFLYLHCHPKDPLGWDLRGVMMQLGVLEENVDYMLLPKKHEEDMPKVDVLNKIYNASDVILTTTLGEGWGLCVESLTKIITTNGVKNIKDIIVGDTVLGNDGIFHPVLDTTYRKVDVLLNIKTAYGYNIKTTEEHPFYVLSNGVESWQKANILTKGDYIGIVKPVGNRVMPEYIDLADYLPNNEDGWCIEDNCIYHKFGYSPKSKEWSYKTIVSRYKTTIKIAENARSFIAKGGKASKVSIDLANKMIDDGYEAIEPLKINRFIKITDDLLEVIGLYLADGSNENGNRIEFSLNVTTKKEISQKVKNVFENYFNIKDVVIKKTGKKLAVRISSSLIAKVFSYLFGNGSYNKKIPDIFTGCEKSLMPIIKGFFRGDGHIDLKKNNINFATTSASLAYQCLSILSSNNIFCSIRQNKNGNIYICTIPNAHLRKYLNSTGQNGDIRRDNTRQHKAKFIETDTHFFTPVLFNNVLNGSFDVYDLCVEDSHSFVGNGIVCHNTFTEAAACKKPIVAPYSTSFIEMSGYGKRAFMLTTLYPSCNTIDNAIRQQVDIYEVADTLALVARKIIENPIIQDTDLNARITAAYHWNKSLEWSNVCKSWINYFNETF